MLNLQSVLSRLGEETLSDWLGNSTVELIQTLNLGRPSSVTLAKLLINRHSPQEILLDRGYRKRILNALKQDEAENLCLLLNATAENPWDALQSVNITRAGANYSDLLKAFDLPLPQANDNDLPPPRENTTDIAPQYPLFSHQVEASRSVIEKLRGHGRVVLHMPTGAGKTRTAMNVIADLLRQQLPMPTVVFWLAHSEELCEQAASEFENCWSRLGSYNFPVHRHFGANRVNLDEIKAGFLVMSLSLAHKTCFGSDEAFFNLARQTRLVIMDEAHQAIAVTYQHVLNILAPSNNVSLLGLTATPGRSWLNAHEDLRLAEFFNRQKVTLNVAGYNNPIEYLREEGYLSRVITEPILYSGSYKKINPELEKNEIAKGFDLSPKALKEISDDATRNLRIIQRIRDEEHAGEKIIVFACSVEHAEVLTTILNLMNINASCVTGSTPSDQRRNAIDQFKNGTTLNILVSCDVLTTGFDAPKASVAVIARPTQSLVLYSQMVGRVVRGPKAGGTEKCKVITVVDQVFGFRDLGEAFIFWDDLWE